MKRIPLGLGTRKGEIESSKEKRSEEGEGVCRGKNTDK